MCNTIIEFEYYCILLYLLLSSFGFLECTIIIIRFNGFDFVIYYKLCPEEQ